MLNPNAPARYRLRLQGCVHADWSDWLVDSQVSFNEAGPATSTVLQGTVRDQAGLFGLISQVRNLGAGLISVEWIPPEEEV